MVGMLLVYLSPFLLCVRKEKKGPLKTGQGNQFTTWELPTVHEQERCKKDVPLLRVFLRTEVERTERTAMGIYTCNVPVGIMVIFRVQPTFNICSRQSVPVFSFLVERNETGEHLYICLCTYIIHYIHIKAQSIEPWHILQVSTYKQHNLTPEAGPPVQCAS